MDRLGDLVTGVTASAQRLTTSSSASEASTKLAAYHARLILGCYRTDQISDPQVFITAAAAVLSRYPQDVGARLSDPKSGIAGKLKWLPSIAEIKAEADVLAAADAAAARRQADLAEQWRLRDEYESQQRRHPPRLEPQHRANVLVWQEAPQFKAMVARAEAGADPKDWRWHDEHHTAIWVPLGWIPYSHARG